MNLKTFTAGSMAEALALVNKHLGSKAVILHTRSYKRGGFLGLWCTTVVEVTAGDRREVAAKRGERAAQTPAARTSTAAPPVAATTKPNLDAASPNAGDLIRRTYALAMAELAKKQSPADTTTNASGASAISPAIVHTISPVAITTVGAETARLAAPGTTELAEEMRAVKHLVSTMVRQQRTRTKENGRPDMPDKLFDQYLTLLRQEVTEELAEEIVQQVRAKLTHAEMENSAKLKQAMQDAIAELIPTDTTAGRATRGPDNRPRTVALIGPTGVGKTTTIAKLAATFKLRQKLSVGLITLDTYRIAAVEQLRTYANIIGVPLHVVMTEPEMRDALRKLSACDVVLIDTAGRGQRDDPKLAELKRMIDSADPHECHLVLSSTCSLSVLMEAVERFSAVRTDRILFTKLDEAVSFGVLLSVARKVNKRLSYVTTGQEVPHQIEPGRADRLAQLVMGGGI
ncbi:MAG: flagellar biosynthesis protein FlhF [Planctomycetes bacterium]|nr:flagellar biosynthesis protein FlhF [Planctomycetota bacterium]